MGGALFFVIWLLTMIGMFVGYVVLFGCNMQRNESP